MKASFLEGEAVIITLCKNKCTGLPIHSPGIVWSPSHAGSQVVPGNLINIRRNSDSLKPIATDEITILTYYSKGFLGPDKKLILTRLTSQSNEFCNLEAMVQARCQRVLGTEGFGDGWKL